MTLDDQARELYHQAAPCAPTWDQLGDVTRSVWREKAQRKADGDAQWWSCMPRQAVQLPAVGETLALF